MVRFQTYLWIGYFATSVLCYHYLRISYFPHSPTKFEKFISWIMAFCWIVSVPITFMLKQDDAEDNVAFGVSYDGFVGREQ